MKVSHGIGPSLALLATGLLFANTAQAQRQRTYQEQGSQSQAYSEPGFQGQGYQEQGYQGQGSQRQGQGFINDRIIASWLANLNKAEVELAKSVRGQASVDAVNQFAKRQVKDHQEILKELSRFTPNAGAGIGDSDESEEPSSNRGNSGTLRWQAGYQATSQDQAQRPVNYGQLWRDIVNEGLRALTSELQEQRGLDFDWAFVGQQAVLHDQMVAEMRVLRRYASPQLAEVIDDAMDEARQDQKKLAQIMDQLKQIEQRERSSYGGHSSQDENSENSRRSSNSGYSSSGADRDRD